MAGLVLGAAEKALSSPLLDLDIKEADKALVNITGGSDMTLGEAEAAVRMLQDAIAANPAIVAEYRAGKEKAFNSLVGKVMAASKGKANPAQVNAALKKKLG